MLVAFSSTNVQLKVATWFHSGVEACGLFLVCMQVAIDLGFCL